MSLINFGKQIIYNFKNGVKSFTFANSNVDRVDDLNIIIHKMADAVVSGQFVKVNERGEEIEAKVPIEIASPNLLQDWKEMYKGAYIRCKLDGVVYLYKSGKTTHVLFEDECNYSYNNISKLNLVSYTDLYHSFTHTTGGKTIDILAKVRAKEAELIPFFDIGIKYDTMEIITRSKMINDIINLSDKAIKGAQHSYNLTAFKYLAPKSTDTKGWTPPFDKTDEQKLHENNKFQEQRDVKHGTLQVLDSPMEILDGMVDIKKLDAISHLDFSAERMCNMYGLPYKLFKGETKYDDLAVYVPQLFRNIQPWADSWTMTVCELNKQKGYRLSYKSVVENELMNYNDNQSSIIEGENEEE